MPPPTDPPSTPSPRSPFEAAVKALPPEFVAQLAGLLVDGDLTSVPPRPKSVRRPRRREPVCYRIIVTLDDSEPPIRRCLEVRSDLMLDTFHRVLQAAFGWDDGHLHRFSSGDNAFDPRAEHYLCKWDAEEGDAGVPDSKVRLDETLVDPGDNLRYVYDFGDNWELTIELETVQPAPDPFPAAICVAGERAAPPEDCGGLRTAEELAEVLDDPAAFHVAEVNAALTDPFAGISPAGSDGTCATELSELMRRLQGDPAGERFRQAVAQLLETPPPVSTLQERARAVRPILWFLHHVGTTGLALTSAGYLRPADVSALAAELPTMRDWIGLRNREIQSFPVLNFREAMQAVGLVRKNRGRLMLTKGGLAALDRPDRVWRHLLDRLPTGSEKSMDRPSGWLYLASTAAGEADPYHAIADAMTSLGWREGNRLPVSQYAVRDAVSSCSCIAGNLAAGSSGLFEKHPIDPVVMDLCRQIIGGGASGR